MKTDTISSPRITDPVFASPEFWNLYDQFCQDENLQKHLNHPKNPLTQTLCRIMIDAHTNKTQEMHNLSRPERGWKQPNAWLTLRSVPIQRHDGQIAFHVQVGDVMVVEHGWDRDVFTTHSPILENISGYLLSGKWPDMIGLFLPLFDHKTILTCVALRLQKNLEEGLARAYSQAKDWNWPTT